MAGSPEAQKDSAAKPVQSPQRQQPHQEQQEQGQPQQEQGQPVEEQQPLQEQQEAAQRLAAPDPAGAAGQQHASAGNGTDAEVIENGTDPEADRAVQARLDAARKPLYELPTSMYFELPGRPHVVWELLHYKVGEAKRARDEMPFLFKAFEVGQVGPARLKKQLGEARAYTIHEYLDWTVTADSHTGLDFGGFRLLVVLPRFRPTWPPPGAYDKPDPRTYTALGAPKDPLPQLLNGGRAVTAATIRLGPNYLEVPFVATHETRRGRGWGRACLEAIEEVARVLGVPYLLLCSTQDDATVSTWRHLGFVETAPADFDRMQVDNDWLLHMDNTVQMHKTVPPPRVYRSLIIRHQHFAQRVYYLPRGSGSGGHGAGSGGTTTGTGGGGEGARAGAGGGGGGGKRGGKRRRIDSAMLLTAADDISAGTAARSGGTTTAGGGDGGGGSGTTLAGSGGGPAVSSGLQRQHANGGAAAKGAAAGGAPFKGPHKGRRR